MANIASPLVLENTALLEFLQFVLQTHTEPSTILVCSSKEDFLDQLNIATTQLLDQAETDINEPNSQSAEDQKPSASTKQIREFWETPTLRLLSASQTVKFAFCPDVTHVRAYLSTYAFRSPSGELPVRSTFCSTQILAIVNPIQVHKPTSAFSAQGLNRTFSTAVEAAHHSGSRLVMAECAVQPAKSEVVYGAVAEDDEPMRELPASSPWDEEVSILNVTTKSFGAGERGWVGRTVKLRTIAGRWCDFTTLPLEPKD